MTTEPASSARTRRSEPTLVVGSESQARRSGPTLVVGSESQARAPALGTAPDRAAPGPRPARPARRETR